MQGQITDKMPSGLLGTEVKVEIEIMTILEVEVDLSQGEEKNLGPNPTPGLVLIVIESGVIDVGNMTILHQNAPIPQLMRRLTRKKQIQPLYK